jgi:hypothetical protein
MLVLFLNWIFKSQDRAPADIALGAFHPQAGNFSPDRFSRRSSFHHTLWLRQRIFFGVVLSNPN